MSPPSLSLRLRQNNRPYGYRGLKIITSLKLRFQDFQREKSPRNTNIAKELTALIYTEKAKIIGPIRQEVLSGYSDFEQYSKLKDKLMYFPNETIIDDYVTAAVFSNLCRKKGIQGSHIDFLICAVAHRLKMSIYIHDKDFGFYSQIIPIRLYSAS